MDINQLLNSLKEAYSFPDASFTQSPEDSLTEFSFRLTEQHISTFIEKASRLSSIVESCANMVCLCEPELKPLLAQTTIRCAGSNKLCIRTHESMIKMLTDTLFG